MSKISLRSGDNFHMPAKIAGTAAICLPKEIIEMGQAVRPCIKTDGSDDEI